MNSRCGQRFRTKPYVMFGKQVESLCPTPMRRHYRGKSRCLLNLPFEMALRTMHEITSRFVAQIQEFISCTALKYSLMSQGEFDGDIVVSYSDSILPVQTIDIGRTPVPKTPDRSWACTRLAFVETTAKRG